MKRILFLGLFLILTVNMCYAGDSLYFFERRINDILGTNQSEPYPDSVVDRFVNLACREVVTYTGVKVPCVLKRDTIALSQNTFIYTVNNDCYAIYSVGWLRGSERDFERIEWNDWGKETALGSATARFFASAGRTLKVYPRPGSAGTDSLLVWYNTYPREINLDSMKSDIPQEYSQSIIDYALGLCWLKVRDENTANFYFRKFEAEMEIVIGSLQNLPFDLILAPKVEQR